MQEEREGFDEEGEEGGTSVGGFGAAKVVS